MSNTLDTTLTIALFVLGTPLVIYLVLAGFYMAAGDTDGLPEDRPPLSRFLTTVDVAGFVLPALLLASSYVMAIALAWVAPSLTFYYPVLALAVGFAVWYGTFHGLSRWNKRLVKAHIAAYIKQAPENLSEDEAIAAVREYIQLRKIPYPTENLVADRFPLGWSVYAPVQVDTSDPTAFLDMPVERTVFLIGDSGRIEPTSSSRPPLAEQQHFSEVERVVAARRGKWVRRA
ncbi:hypothetical protein A5634_09980 [Mycobacterium asiaticum]|uniref:Uncharacterized protein n=1 Tax=Mycobacterium asiaticum TaxID=1790 RepID=A0A1A3NKI2_MYCAS|nr:hypothetical protein [Mycobacterium asiaticum]OBK21559.1 hypothetical protein A5634_09980 [Mycobacterium asiaticum]